MSDVRSPGRGSGALVVPARLFAPAKLTTELRVVGTRPDGYHLIDAEMVTLDLGDELEVSAGSGLTVTTAEGAPIDTGDADENLVSRALAAIGTDARVVLRKRVPPGAGLGGGSADAAAVLRWAGWGRDEARRSADLAAAARLGADVAFCLLGGRARVGGIGEEVRPLPHVEEVLTLVTPPFGCSTPAVYARWDELGGPEGPHGNDLEPAALAVEPRLAEWRDLLGSRTGRRPRLAGSGSTWFVAGDHHDVLDGVPGVVVARTVPPGYGPPGYGPPGSGSRP